MKIALLTNKYFKYWWIPTFVKHLYKWLSKWNIVHNFYLSNSSKQSSIVKMYNNSNPYYPINILWWEYMTFNQYDILLITSWFIEYNYDFLEYIEAPKKFIVLHDPAEIESNKEIINIIKKYDFKIITIRETVKNYLKNKYWLDSTYILHPYFIENKKTKWNDLVCTARIDWDKHYEIIIEAQKIKDNWIKIYWYENRLVTFNLKKKYNWIWNEIQNWWKWFDENQRKYILWNAKAMIDMSLFKNDWWWTQYTILEAWDYWVLCILNNGWLNWWIMKDWINCLWVSNWIDLVNILDKLKTDNFEKIIDNWREYLKIHDCYKIAENYNLLFNT